MPERPVSVEQPPPIPIAAELRQKAEAATPFIESAKQDAGIILSRAQQFLALHKP